MAWAFVQKKNTSGATAVFASNTTTGNQIIVALTCLTGATSVAISPGSGTFTKTVTLLNGGLTAEIWECPSVTGGTTPTVTITGGTGMEVSAYEFSGGATAGTTDGTNSGNTGTNSLSTGAITTGTAGDLVFKCFAVSGTPNGTAEASWTEVNPTINGNITGYIIQGSAGSITGTDTTTGSVGGPGVIAAFKASSGNYNFSGTGTVKVTGVTNLPAAIPQGLTGAVNVTGVTNLPAAIPQGLTGFIGVSGLIQPSLVLAPLTGSINVTGATNLPAAIPQMTGTINVSGLTNLPAAIPQMTGFIGVTGTTSLGGLSLVGNWGVTGTLNIALATFLSGSVMVNGVYAPSIAPQLPAGLIKATGLYKPAIGVGLPPGAILVTGVITPSYIAGPFPFSGTGLIAVTGRLTPVFQSITPAVTVSSSGVYVCHTVDQSYFVVYLLAGVDYSHWFDFIVSGPYVDNLPAHLQAYNVGIRALHALLDI